VAVLEVAAKKLAIKGYRPSEKGRDPEGDLRYIQMSVDPNVEYDQKVQVVLVWNAANFKEAGALLPKLVKLLRQRSDLFHSITVNFQTAQTNTIFNYNEKSWKLLWGPPVMKQIVGNAVRLYQLYQLSLSISLSSCTFLHFQRYTLTFSLSSSLYMLHANPRIIPSLVLFLQASDFPTSQLGRLCSAYPSLG
jgi:hypothetical protein